MKWLRGTGLAKPAAPLAVRAKISQIGAGIRALAGIRFRARKDLPCWNAWAA